MQGCTIYKEKVHHVHKIMIVGVRGNGKQGNVEPVTTQIKILMHAYISAENMVSPHLARISTAVSVIGLCKKKEIRFHYRRGVRQCFGWIKGLENHQQQNHHTKNLSRGYPVPWMPWTSTLSQSTLQGFGPWMAIDSTRLAAFTRRVVMRRDVLHMMLHP